jgi:long-subunit fatty acid transport protein
VVRRRDWDSVLSMRLGAEGDLSDAWALFGGVAFEPSPVDDATLEPGFPRGDAMVYGLGFSYRAARVTFDVGYSFHDHDARGARAQEALQPQREGRYEAREQVWAASARWRFD